ncbi:MAG: hypothetical protein K0R91_469 [Nitrososphaeraceae archaeon]|jgi:hypothetical protein|nr:hypothetical protein [Nitrososphaeraceae archaeon]
MDLKASQKDLPEPFVPLVQKQSTIEMKDRKHGRGPDMLSMYDQDVILLSVPAVIEMLAVLVVLE